jgi:hypothetical protein
MPGPIDVETGDLLDVAALGAGRLQTQHLLEGGRVVLGQLLLGERRLAHDEVQVGVAVDTELDLAALDVGHGLGDVGGHRAGLRVGHQATGAEDAPEPADLAHHVRRRDDGVEVQPAAGDLLDELVGADVVGAGLTGGLGPVAGREDQHPGGLAGAVRKVDRAAHHLVCLAGVDTEAHGDVDRGVELGAARLLGERHGAEGGVDRVLIDGRGGGPVLLASLHELVPFTRCGRPGRRSGPATVAWVMRVMARVSRRP